jgi:hypothetical protein
VLVPSIGGENMQAVLAVFRGEATLAEAPDQVLDTVPETTLEPSTGQPSTDQPTTDQPTTTDPSTEPAPAATAPESATTTLPNVVADENEFGFVPDKNVTC